MRRRIGTESTLCLMVREEVVTLPVGNQEIHIFKNEFESQEERVLAISDLEIKNASPAGKVSDEGI